MLMRAILLLILLSPALADAASVTLAWDYTQSPELPADGFVVYRCAGQQCSNFTHVTPAPLSVNVLTYTDSTLTAGSWYTWVVRATAGQLLSDPSPAVSVQIPALATKPAPPRNVRRMATP